MRTSARTSMYKPNGKSHVRAALKMSYKHVDVRGLSHFCVHTPSLCVGRPSRRVGIPSGRAVSVRHLRCVCTYPRSYTIQTLTDDFYSMRMRTPFFVRLGV